MSALDRPEFTFRNAAEAVAELYAGHARMVAGICRGMLWDPDEAADAVQETFVAAQRSLVAGTHPNEPAAWLATIARNECRMRIRRRMAAPMTTVLDENLDGHGDTTYGGAVQAAGIAELREALVDMPERQREALLLREVRGLSYDEVAKAMDVSPPAVETLIFRARKRVIERVRVVPSLVFAWAKDSLTRLGGPADIATAGAFAAKGAAALVAALTATSAAVEVKDRATASTAPAVVTARVDNSGPGSASSGRGRGRGEGDDELRSDSSGKGSGSRAEDDEVRSASSGKGSGSRIEDSSGSDDSGKGRGRGRGRSGSDEPDSD